MPKFKVFNRWSEDILYQQFLEVEAETMEEAIKLSKDTEDSWSDPEQIDTLGDGSINYVAVENLATEEYREFFDIEDLIEGEG